MESNDRRQRQNHPPGYVGPQGLPQITGQYSSAPASERYRQPSLTAQSPTSAPSTARAGQQPGYNYGYGEGSQFVGSTMQTGAMQYQTEYGQESQRGQQQYQPYGSSMLYSVPSQQQTSPQSPYDTVQPYQSRPSAAALDVLSNQFNVPQQYYVQGESGPTSAPSVPVAAQNVPSQYPPISYTSQTPAGRESIGSTYATGITDPSPSAAPGAFGQSMSQSQNEMSEAYAQYQHELKKTFQSIRDGHLAEAGRQTLELSTWLLTHAEVLG